MPKSLEEWIQINQLSTTSFQDIMDMYTEFSANRNDDIDWRIENPSILEAELNDEIDYNEVEKASAELLKVKEKQVYNDKFAKCVNSNKFKKLIVDEY